MLAALYLGMDKIRVFAAEHSTVSGYRMTAIALIVLLGVVPACITILISIIPKKIPVIGSKWFNVLVCVPVFLSYGLIWIEIKAIEHFSGSDFTKDVAYYLWVSGLSLTFIAAFFTNRSNTKA